MPRGRRTSYVRDNRGRFASSPGGGGPKRSTPATRRAATRAGNRLNRDNSGRISGIGRNGATVRGGRLKTAKGSRRATQLASMKPAGFRASTIAKGGRGVRGMVARSLAAARKERMAAARPAATKQQPQKPSKKPANKAQRSYLAARSNARARGGDLRGADAGSRRMANSAAAVVRGMERRSSAAVPKSPADSPRAKQQQRQAARAQRAIRNQRAAWAREADGPGSKASRSATVARRAQQIYDGKVDPKAKTKSRLTKTRDPEVLRKRIAKIKDNTARAAAKAAKTATPVRPATSNRPKRALAVRVGRADRADNKLAAQLKQAKASENLKKENEIIRRRQRIDRFSKTYNFADLKASRKALTPTKPTAPKRTRSARPAGTVAKPRGMKPGALAARRGVKVSAEQRAIATAYKKQINSRNIRATRAMLRAVAKDQGYTGKDAIRRLTQTLDRGYSGGPLGGMAKPLPLNRQRGNAYSARKSRELGLNRRFSDALWIASPTTKRTSAAYDLADETLSGRHTRSALKAAAQQLRRRAGKPRRRSKP